MTTQISCLEFLPSRYTAMSVFPQPLNPPHHCAGCFWSAIHVFASIMYVHVLQVIKLCFGREGYQSRDVGVIPVESLAIGRVHG